MKHSFKKLIGGIWIAALAQWALVSLPIFSAMNHAFPYITWTDFFEPLIVGLLYAGAFFLYFRDTFKNLPKSGHSIIAPHHAKNILLVLVFVASFLLGMHTITNPAMWISQERGELDLFSFYSFLDGEFAHGLLYVCFLGAAFIGVLLEIPSSTLKPSKKSLTSILTLGILGGVGWAFAIVEGRGWIVAPFLPLLLASLLYLYLKYRFSFKEKPWTLFFGVFQSWGIITLAVWILVFGFQGFTDSYLYSEFLQFKP